MQSRDHEQEHAPTEVSVDKGPAAPTPTSHRLTWLDVGFLLAPLLFYLWTVSPTIGLGDTALLLDAIEERKISTHVNNHNLTIVLAWLVSHLPIGEAPFRGNVASALTGALTVWLFYVVVLRSAGSRLTALASALVMMVSHSLWWHSTIVECYAINALFTVAAIGCLASIRRGSDRALAGLFFIAGLSLFNHVQMGVIALAAAVVLGWRSIVILRSGQTGNGKRALLLIASATVLFLAGFAPYLLTFLRDLRQTGDFERAFTAATVGSFRSIMFKGTWAWGLRDLGFLVFMQFPSPWLVLVPLGIVSLGRRWRLSAALAGLTAMFVVGTLFFMFYNTWDKFAFLLPSFIILGFVAAHAFDDVRAWIATRRAPRRAWLWTTLVGATLVSIVFPVYFYPQLSRWGQDPGFWHARYNNNYTRNTHNAAEYIANPNKRDYRDVRAFADLLFEHLPENALYIDDDSRAYYPVSYLQRTLNQRRDLRIQIINSWGFAGWGWSKQAFATWLGLAYRDDTPAFLVSIDWPFNDFIASAAEQRGHPFEFEVFPLDDTRWIYRLVTSTETGDSTAAPYRAEIRALLTGVGFNTTDATVKRRFETTERIMTALDFAPNTSEFQVHFRWLAPDGEVFFESTPFIVPLLNTRTWSFLERSVPAGGGDLPSGHWRVEAVSDTTRLAESAFDVIAH